MSATADRLVAQYVKRLNRELRDLPRAERSELVAEIEEHIAEGRAELDADDMTEACVLIARLGEPEEIAAAARERLALPPRGHGAAEIFALIGLLIGGFALVVGWFVGLALLWRSGAWTTREKLVGTFLVPGGLLPAFLLIGAGAATCGGGYISETSGPVDPYCTVTLSVPGQVLWTALLAVCLVGPIFTTVFLARRIRRPADRYQPRAASA